MLLLYLHCLHDADGAIVFGLFVGAKHVHLDTFIQVFVHTKSFYRLAVDTQYIAVMMSV